MSQIRSHDHRTTLIEFAKLNLLVAPRRLQENQLGATSRCVPTNLLKPSTSR
jgi:hypothetical protein